MKSGICLRSETGEVDCVIIDAQQQGRVFYCEDLDSTTRIEGLTIMGGYALGDGALPMLDDSGGGLLCLRSSLTVSNCVFQGNSAHSGGGAVVCDAGVPQFVGCTFTGNSVAMPGGGAIYCGVSEARLRDCIFSDNHGWWGGSVHNDASDVQIIGCSFTGNTGYVGGAVYSRGESSSAIQGCTFSGNSANEGGGAVHGNSGSSLTIEECIFSGNSAGVDGGAVHGWHNTSIILRDCRVSENTANAGGGLLSRGGSAIVENSTFFGNVAVSTGGGVFAIASSFTCEGNTFSDNLANTYAGAICLSHLTTTSMTSCTIAGNAAPCGGGLHLETSATLLLERSIIAFSTDGQAIHSWSGGGIDVECCDLFGNEGGDWVGWVEHHYGMNGNISEDPLFCDPGFHDFRLDCQSPCAATQQPECDLIGAWPVGCGSTTVEKTTWSSLKALYR
jgi:predicted outer membrane repeat protein